MNEIILSIPEDLQNDIGRIKQENGIDMSYTEFCQYLLKLGLNNVSKGESKKQ